MRKRRPDQKILMVTGKGGVGKSVIAAAFVAKLASDGHKTLLVELGDQSFYRYILGVNPTFQPTTVRSNWDVACWDGENCLKEYLAYLIKISTVVNLFFENRVMKTLIQAAPALKELAILGKLTSGIRGVGPELNYDRIVVDTYATGHFKALMNAPVGMSEAIKVGPMGEQSVAIQKVIKDPAHTKICIVSLPEELPVNESLELHAFLKQNFSQTADIVLNRLLPIPLSADALGRLTTELSAIPETQRAQRFANHLAMIQNRQEEYRAELLKLSSDLQVVPHLLKPTSLELIDELAQRVESPWPST